MDLINNNPYRIIGILSNDSERELQKQKNKILAYLKVGKEIKSEYDFLLLSRLTRTEESINKALSNIEQNQDRVNYSLFWFLNISSVDNMAIEYLKNGDREKAGEIWDKTTSFNKVTPKNFAAFNNVGTYKLLSHKLMDLKEGIEAKLTLIESDYFKDFVHLVADETFTIDQQKQSENFIDELLEHFKDKYSTSKVLQLFSNCSDSTQNYISRKFTEEPLHNIERQVENCKKKRKENGRKAYELGLKLFKNAKDDLSLLKSLLGTNDLKFRTVADQLAKEIMQCSIDYFNESQENDSNKDYLEEAKKLIKIADSLAISQLVKDRVKDNLDTLSEMEDSELSSAIKLLISVKSSYETNKAQITDEVNAMPLGYNQSINWRKVNRVIEKSIDWDKVVELIKRVIPRSNIEKIRNSPQGTLIREYRTLVDFVLSKLSYSQLNEVKYIGYWSDESAAWGAAKNIVSKNTEGACYIATMAYGDYSHPQVMKLRKFRDNVLSKSKIGRGFIKLYYRYSPVLVKGLKNKKNINLIIRKVLDLFIKGITK